MKGACLRYDAVEEILIATPFKGGPNCWTSSDWLVILSPLCLLALVIFVFIISSCEKCLERSKRPQRSNETLSKREEDDEFVQMQNMSHENKKNLEIEPQGKEDEEFIPSNELNN